MSAFDQTYLDRVIELFCTIKGFDDFEDEFTFLGGNLSLYLKLKIFFKQNKIELN